jgi:hypothetical protein
VEYKRESVGLDFCQEIKLGDKFERPKVVSGGSKGGIWCSVTLVQSS